MRNMVLPFTMSERAISKEETALRRRFLFRLLRRFDFSAPRFRGEHISDAFPDGLRPKNAPPRKPPWQTGDF